MERNEPSIVEQAKVLIDYTLGGPGVILGARRQLAIGALITVCVVFLSSLGGMKPFDTWLIFALLGFVVGIPCLAAEFYMSTIATGEPQNLGEKLVTAAHQIMTFRFVADFVGFIGAVVGIVAYVGHLASWAAWVFLLVIPALLALYGALLYLIGLGHAIQERGRNAPPGH
jgi:hypothetical protein